MGPGSCFVCWKFCKSPSVSNYKKSRFTTARVNHLSTEKGRTLCRSGNICRSFWCAFARFCCELKYLTHIIAAGVTLCNRDSPQIVKWYECACEWTCEKIWNIVKRYEMSFSGKGSWKKIWNEFFQEKVPEMQFFHFLNTRSIVKWSVKCICEMRS